MRCKLLATTILLAPLATARAQQPPLQPGQPIRPSYDCQQRPLSTEAIRRDCGRTGLSVALDPDTLVWNEKRDRLVRRLPLPAIEQLEAQVARTSADTASGGCWAARPADRCRSYPITEFKAMFRVAPERHFAIESDLGWMLNVGRRSAVGVVGYVALDVSALSLDEGGVRLGGMARYRRWLGAASNVEIGLGGVLTGQESGSDLKPAPSVTLDLNPSPYVGLFGRMDGARRPRTSCYGGVSWDNSDIWGGFCNQSTIRTDFLWYLGAKLGARPGAVASALAAAVIVAYGIVLAGAGFSFM